MKRNFLLAINILFKTIYLYIFFRLSTLNEIINRFNTLQPSSASFCSDPSKIAKLIRIFLKYLFFSKNCLQRSFILGAILKMNGEKPKLIIGVSLMDSFDSHAWIEIKGVPILENFNPDRYKVIYKT